MRRVAQTWWPLAASWVLMGAELPALAAVIARLPEPEINLAAYGGVVFPLALIIESPVIMLLAASTALCKDWDSYILVRRFSIRLGVILTALHVLVAFTPLYYVVVEGMIGVPPEIVEPARVGLMIMTPWTLAIAYRRFHQGVLIRFGHSRAVGLGSVLRLSADAIVLTIGFLVGTIPGIVVATSAVIAGVLTEAVFVGLTVQPVLRDQLKPAEPVKPPLTFRAFLDFYVPLAMTSLLILLVQPIGAAALSRMPRALESLAVWPVVSGLIFMLRSLGIAYNEVVVALLDEPGSTSSLRRFATLLTFATTLMMVIIAATPLATIWFGLISGLALPLVALAHTALWLALPLPGLNVLQSWYQGALVNARSTRAVTEAMGIFLLTTSALLWAGVVWGQLAGLYIGLVAFGVGSFAQTAWLWLRSRLVMKRLDERDAGRPSAHSPLTDTLSVPENP
jgi:hypothetical protein